MGQRGFAMEKPRTGFVRASTLFCLGLGAGIFAGLSRPAAAAPKPAGPEALQPELAIPDALRPWVGWVLHEKEAELCPFVDGAEERECAWPARLQLALDEHGGRFSQQWRLYARARVPLPGDARRWPQEVRVDGKAAVVVPDGEQPSVLLGAGEHVVTGAFVWDELPESLRIPKETGLVALTLRGRAVEAPNRGDDGELFLQREAAANEEADSLDLSVHRQVVDEIPLVLTTRIELRVAGRSREVVLGRALPEGFVPTALDSPLPARLEADSRLRVQVRAGTWPLVLTARHEGPVSELRRPSPDGPWKEGEEVWVFEARPSLRVVTVEGVASIDPNQTTLPDAWKRLPAYPMKPGDTLKLVEQRRGDSDPAPDRLSLRRELWLDFDGRGYTVSDRISGALHRAWRLDVNPPMELGRVAVGGVDQFITTDEHGDRKRAGVEIRQGRVDVSADSRIGRSRLLPAVGWDADFHDVEGVLHLPPGWRLLHASGADDVPGTWVRAWTLLDLFLALIIAMAVAQLHGRRWGALALATLVLCLPESDAPRWAWLGVLAASALLRVLPTGRLASLLRLARVGAGAVLAVVSLQFAVYELRHGMYPALENPVVTGGMSSPQAEEIPAQAGEAGVVDDQSVTFRGGGNGAGVALDGRLSANAPLVQALRTDGTTKIGHGADVMGLVGGAGSMPPAPRRPRRRPRARWARSRATRRAS
jgi:hypothetical protein